MSSNRPTEQELYCLCDGGGVAWHQNGLAYCTACGRDFHPDNLEPYRVQLRRTRGWRMPPNTVKVDRTSRWGNPFTLCDLSLSLALFKNLVAGVWDPSVIPADTPPMMWDHLYGCYQTGQSMLRPHPMELIRQELRGKNLACWCKPGAPCHADVLLEIANG